MCLGEAVRSRKRGKRAPEILFQHFNKIYPPLCNNTDSAFHPAVVDAIILLCHSPLNTVYRRMQQWMDGYLPRKCLPDRDAFSCTGCPYPQEDNRAITRNVFWDVCFLSELCWSYLWAPWMQSRWQTAVRLMGPLFLSLCFLFFPCRVVWCLAAFRTFLSLLWLLWICSISMQIVFMCKRLGFHIRLWVIFLRIKNRNQELDASQTCLFQCNYFLFQIWLFLVMAVVLGVLMHQFMC